MDADQLPPESKKERHRRSMERLVRWLRRQICKLGIHDKRTGARVQIRGDVWHVTYEYRCRRCPENLGERSCTYPPNTGAQATTPGQEPKNQ